MRVWLLILLLGLTGCRQPSFYHQPVERNLRPVDGSGWSRRPPPQTVAQDEASGPGRPSADATPRRDDPTLPPVAVTRALVDRGHQRFDIYCAPCHAPSGDGDGMVVQRGFPHPPSFHAPPLRTAGPGWFVYVIGHGYGRMSSYADRVEPDDRWAIAVYVKALQLSQDFPPDALSPAERAQVGIR